MKDRSDDPSHHERTLLPWSYISLPNYNNAEPIQSQFTMMFLQFSSDEDIIVLVLEAANGDQVWFCVCMCVCVCVCVCLICEMFCFCFWGEGFLLFFLLKKAFHEVSTLLLHFCYTSCGVVAE